MTAFTQVFVQATFAQANQSGWNPASGGGNWTTQFVSPTLSIASNEGHATGVAGNDWMAYLGGTITNTEVLVRCTISDFANDGVGVYLRYQDTNNWYRVFLYGSSLAVDKKVAGTYTGAIATTPLTPTNNSFYWIRVHIETSSIQAKWWASGSSEPAYQISVTDTSIASAGHVGVGAYQNASGDVSQFDNFTAYQAPTTTSIAKSLATRLRVAASSLKNVPARLRLGSANSKGIASRLLLLSGTPQARFTSLRARIAAQKSQNIRTRLGVGVAQTRALAARLWLGAAAQNSAVVRMRLASFRWRTISHRLFVGDTQQQHLSLRLITLPGTTRPHTYVPPTPTTSFAGFQGIGPVVPILPPRLPYQMNGTIIDDPVVCTAPELFGTIVPAGSRFLLKWYLPSFATQALLQDQAVVQLTFGLSGDMVTGPVRLQVSTIGFDVLAVCTTLADIRVQRWILSSQFA